MSKAAAPSGGGGGAGNRRQRDGGADDGKKKHVAPLDKFDMATFQMECGLRDDDVVLGIDEAGRGPAIGAMVYGAAMVSVAQHQRVVDTGVNDSKQLDEKTREAVRRALERLDRQPDSTFRALVLPINPEVISEAMFGRAGHRTLNTLSHDAAIALIKRATELTKGKLAAVFVDTVGPPSTYERLLRGRFPHLHIRVEKKADARFPVVSAASIFAKTDRDRFIAQDYPNGEVGSGYPSDPRTTEFLNGGGLLNRFFGFTSADIRLSWGPVKKITDAKCIEAVFEADDDKARETGGAVSAAGRLAAGSDGMKQLALSFSTKLPPKRDFVFSTLLGLQSPTAVM
jgi:ribonuclease H2 subunit A